MEVRICKFIYKISLSPEKKDKFKLAVYIQGRGGKSASYDGINRIASLYLRNYEKPEYLKTKVNYENLVSEIFLSLSKIFHINGFELIKIELWRNKNQVIIKSRETILPSQRIGLDISLKRLDEIR